MNTPLPDCSEAVATLAAWLAGSGSVAATVDPSRLVDCSRQHGVAGLLYELLVGQPQRDHLPGLIEPLQALARIQAIREMVQSAEDNRVLAALAAADIPVLVLKGAALARTHYPAPHLRPREDTDLLVRDADRQAVTRVMETLGYQPQLAISGEHVMQQHSYTRHDRDGNGYVFDIHWRLSNPLVFSNRFDFRELYARSVPLDGLDDRVRAPAPVDALVYACLHRVAHHHDSDRLIWLYDIHLLARSLTTAQAEQIVTLAREKELAGITARGLATARDMFGTVLAPAIGDFVAMAQAEIGEPGSEFGTRGRRRAALLWSDLRALQGWRERARYLRENILPDPDYLLRRYGKRNPLWLPWLYLRRALQGTWRLLRRVS